MDGYSEIHILYAEFKPIVLAHIHIQHDSLVLSPPLAFGNLCPKCWMFRRLSCTNQANYTSNQEAKQLFLHQILTGRPESKIGASKPQINRLSCILSSYIPHANTRPRELPARLCLIDRCGEITTEPVLPHPYCSQCYYYHMRWSFQSIQNTLGGTAGIIREATLFPALGGFPAWPFVVSTRLANSQLLNSWEDGSGASGKGETPEQALSSAIFESIERYCSAFKPRNIVCFQKPLSSPYIDHSCLAGLDISYGSDQLASCSENYEWVQARLLRDHSKSILIPVESAVCTPTLDQKRHFSHLSTSNGLATGMTLDEAILRGLSEVIERHFFFLVWYGLSPSLLEDATGYLDNAIVKEFEESGYKIQTAVLGCMENTYVACCSCFLQATPDQHILPRFALGLGTGESISISISRASLEMGQVIRGLSYAYRSQSLAKRLDDFNDESFTVVAPYDHALFYSCINPVNIPYPFGLGPRRRGGKLLRKAQLDSAAFFEVTTPDISFYTPLHVVRVVVPDMIPLHFGYSNIPRSLIEVAEDYTIELMRCPHPLS